MCTGYPLIAKAGLGAVGALAGWANRDKLKKGFRKLGGYVDKASDHLRIGG